MNSHSRFAAVSVAAGFVCVCGALPIQTASADSVVVFNEIMYHLAAANPAAEIAAEWIELRNQMAVDIDLSRWSLSGGVNYTFPDGTIVRGHGFLVVAANPASSGIPGALGPWTGKLDNGGEKLVLENNNGRVLDEVDYGTSGNWPAAPDGAGPSLAKSDINLPSPKADSWRSSAQTGGTPGAENFFAFLPPVTSTIVAAAGSWKYRADGSDLGTAWKDEGASESGFAAAPAAFQLGSDPLPAPASFGTPLPSGPTTYYFRRDFTFSGQTEFTTLRLRLLADDGAAVYLNGAEVSRINLPAAAGYGTPALNPRRAAPVWQEFNVPAVPLRNGSNLLAAEVHQAAVLPAYPAAVLASGPVAYWRLGESSTTIGAVGDLADLPAAPESGAQNGTMQGLAGSSLATPGPRPTDTINSQPLLGFEATNAAPTFQGNNDGGNDVVLVPDPGPLNFAAGAKFSLEAWVKAPAGQESGGAIVAKGSGGGGEQFAIDVVSNTYRFFQWDATTPAVVNSSVPPNNSWQYVVAVFDSAAGVMRIYVNGVQTGSGAPRPAMVNSNHELSIGARKNAGSSAYDLNLIGSVDEVAVYDRVLTPAEITAHYNAAFATSSSGIDTTDAAFAAELIAIETLPAASSVSLALNEVSTTDVEIMNFGTASVNLAGGTLVRVTPTGLTTLALPAQVLAPGRFLTLSQNAVAGDRIVLFAADGVTALDSLEVKTTPRGRHPDGTGPWLRPNAPTPNAANSFTLHDEIVINEIMYDHPSALLLQPGASQPGQWVELFNKSAATVDLSGWKFTNGINFDFPAGTALAAGSHLVVAENPAALIAGHNLPPAQVFGPWSGKLSHASDRLVLEDAAENPADEVQFFSDGRWPAAANAGGSSLELLDPDADNNVGESWAASDESNKATWQTFTWSGPSVASQAGEPTLWRELALLLVDGPGECLVDDVRVTDTTTSANLIQNGNFSAGPAHWRLLGNHRTSRVEAEPGNPANSVLHVVASGPGEYQGNQIETTFLDNTALVEGRTYEVSLRARWLSGAGRLNTRLYFNRLPRTNLLAVVPNGGTPGAPNSRAVTNAGPTFDNLAHSPVVPLASQPVTVAVDAADPNGIASMALKFSVSEPPAWQTVGMTSANGRHFSGIIPGQSAGVIQFYIEGTDSQGATSSFPARGQNSRALIQVQDGQASASLQNVRLVMTAADATYMHTNVNTLSNEFLGATLVVDERVVYYDIGVRLKGSFVGRNVPRVGFTLRFNGDRLFRGVHDKVAVDRSQHVAVGQGEIIAKHVAYHAGGIPDMYDDLAYFIHPQAGYTSVCQLRTTAFDEIYLDSQFPKGSDGTMFEIEVIRWHTNTIDGLPESLKQVGPNAYANLEVQNWGNDREAYRWTALQTMHRDRDDFTSMIALEKMFGQPQGTAFRTEAQQRLDYEEWLRTLAYQSLVGTGDAVYTATNLHNYRVFFRPNDGRAMYMPWDWDSSFQRATNGSLVGSSNLAKAVNASQDTLRRYYCHLYDIIQGSFNQGYMSRWTQHYGVLAGQDFSGILSYINSRATFVLSQLPTATAFTSAAGTVNANGAVTLTGTANIQVAFIEVNGLAYTPTWTSTSAWTLTVPLATGPNTLVIRGLNKSHGVVAGASSTLNIDNPNAPGWAPLRINEWLAENDGSFLDPADNNSDDWFELYNPTSQPVDLSGWKLSDVPANPALFTIPNGWNIPANGFLLVWADEETVQNSSIPTAASQLHVGFRLNNAGETLILSAPDNREIDRVTFGSQTADDSEGRYADGAPTAYSLTVPTPGAANVLTKFSRISMNSMPPQLELTSTPGWVYRLESSADLATWLPSAAPVTATGPAVMIPAAPSGARLFFRVLTEK